MPDMGRGIIAPANGDNIGTGASEMRTLASTAATAIGDLEAQTAGALDGKANTSHTHQLADVGGLLERLAALEYRSGRRNITALLDPAPVSGGLYIERRGDTVWLHMNALVLTSTGFAANLYNGVIPSGFQAAVPIEAPTSPRIVQSLDYPESNPDVDTNIRTYNQVLGFYRVRPGAVVRGMTSWPTNQAIPTTLPGTPA